ncbi:MAG: DUF11 domain-containing protein [Myxococcaceae bacterium]|nr:MAG: DUF11 domain-containing protein [Myxococcaceae bacterium]
MHPPIQTHHPSISLSRTASRALLLMGLLGFALPSWAAPPVAFGPPVDSGTGIGPRSVAVGDLNKDGTPDVVTLNAGDRTVSILTGTPTGPFTVRKTALLPLAMSNPVAVAVGAGADFDQDGNVDVAVVGNNLLAVFFGDGTGGFRSPDPRVTTVSGETNLRGLAIGDITLGSTPELVTLSPAIRSALLVTYQGAAPEKVDEVLVGIDPLDVTLGDGNGDDVPLDIVSVNAAGQAIVRATDGNGSFYSGFAITIPTGASRVAMVDVTGDGLQDLLVAGQNFVSVNRRTGDIDYAPFVTSTTTVNAQSMAVADFNGDGALDVALAPGNAPDVTVLLNQGDGTFAQPVVIPTVSNATALATGDFDGDGKPELVVAKGQANTVSVFRTVPVQTPKADAVVRLFARPQLGLLVPAIAYDVRVTNNGPAPLTSTSVRAALPPGLTATSSACTPSAGAVTCDFGPLAPGASQTRTFSIPLRLLGLGLTYDVKATRMMGVPEDPNPLNDQDSRSCLVLTRLLVLCD